MRAKLQLRARLGLGLMLAPILELNLWLELGGKLIGAGPRGLKYFNTVRAPPGGGRNTSIRPEHHQER